MMTVDELCPRCLNVMCDGCDVCDVCDSEMIAMTLEVNYCDIVC